MGTYYFVVVEINSMGKGMNTGCTNKPFTVKKVVYIFMWLVVNRMYTLMKTGNSRARNKAR